MANNQPHLYEVKWDLPAGYSHREVWVDFFGCWLFIKDHPKWSVAQTTLREIVTLREEKNNDDNGTEGKKSSVADRPVAERSQGQKAAKAERKQLKSKESLDEMNAESLQLRQ